MNERHQLFFFYSTFQPVGERHLPLKEFEWVRMMMVLIVILHLWCLPPRGLPLQGLDLRIALNLLSSLFSSLTLLLSSESFLPAATRPGSLFGFVLFLSFEVSC